MNRSKEQALQLDEEYRSLLRLFTDFCQQAGALAEQFGFFGWPDYEDAPPHTRDFTLLGEERTLELHCHPGPNGELIGHIKVRDPRGQVHAALSYRPQGALLLETGHLLDDPSDLLLRLLLGAVYHEGQKG
ncbi:hypothetical protein LA374_00780 [Aeromonas schubertii]|uniref:Uncharacterized protein n=1 Tax=Aeromonas schubertii TaxID=652 RepID=A0ABS7V759_9GAMM|nr:hypothetical protein [Aeromonas schubertii]MBZ6064754.1 hypothetical protein [Aeromonas schubertii]